MPAPKEPLEDGLYSKFHSLLPWQVALHCRAPPCMRTLAFWVKENSSAVGKVLRNYRFTDCWAQSTLAILFRPRGAERVQYEGIAYSQRGGIHHNLVGIKSLCVECHAPRFVVNGTAAVLTRGLSIVTVAVKPRGRVGPTYMLPNTHPSISTMSCLKSFIDVLRLNALAIRSPSTGSCAGLWQPKCYTLSWRIVNWRMTSG